MPSDHSPTIIRPEWSLPVGVQALLTTRLGPGASLPPFDHFNLGSRCGDDAEAVVANRTALATLVGPRSPILWLQQVHGTTVWDASEWDGRAEPVADAAVAHRSGVALAVLTADCLPLLLCSNDGRHIGVAHAGWRGLAAGVIERSVAAIGCAPSALRVWLGACIGSHSYEIDASVRDAFVRHDERADACFHHTRPGHWQCDLEQLARQRLAALGVSNVSGGGYDTARDPRFYSYRATTPTGRFASLIWIE
ncbi:MAG: peptidoglycan editing factor PgeF [Dokdonella sp.]